MDIEIVGDKVPAGCGKRAFNYILDMRYEVILIARIAQEMVSIRPLATAKLTMND